MNKPDDIPEDVWDAANVAYIAIDDHALAPMDCLHCGGLSIDQWATQAVIARAILAERERCARIADHYTKAKACRRTRGLTTHEVYEVKIFARLIAASIRDRHVEQQLSAA